MNLKPLRNLRVRVYGEGPIYEGTCELLKRHGWNIVDEQPYHLQILANVTRILSVKELESAMFGTLCFHPSLLPRHRGRDAVYWTLQMGDTETGVTWFWIDKGIDTGPIAIQHAVHVPEDTSPGRLYYQTLVPLGIELLEELLPRLACGDIPREIQDERLATYEPPRSKPVKIDATRWIEEGAHV
jgi:methionyl-tRNA formyltransferase